MFAEEPDDEDMIVEDEAKGECASERDRLGLSVASVHLVVLQKSTAVCLISPDDIVCIQPIETPTAPVTLAGDTEEGKNNDTNEDSNHDVLHDLLDGDAPEGEEADDSMLSLKRKSEFDCFVLSVLTWSTV